MTDRPRTAGAPVRRTGGSVLVATGILLSRLAGLVRESAVSSSFWLGRRPPVLLPPEERPRMKL